MTWESASLTVQSCCILALRWSREVTTSFTRESSFWFQVSMPWAYFEFAASNCDVDEVMVCWMASILVVRRVS